MAKTKKMRAPKREGDIVIRKAAEVGRGHPPVLDPEAERKTRCAAFASAHSQALEARRGADSAFRQARIIGQSAVGELLQAKGQDRDHILQYGICPRTLNLQSCRKHRCHFQLHLRSPTLSVAYHLDSMVFLRRRLHHQITKAPGLLRHHHFRLKCSHLIRRFTLGLTPISPHWCHHRRLHIFLRQLTPALLGRFNNIMIQFPSRPSLLKLLVYGLPDKGTTSAGARTEVVVGHNLGGVTEMVGTDKGETKTACSSVLLLRPDGVSLVIKSSTESEIEREIGRW